MITKYYQSGRVDFYYDDNMKLCNIRINNLTKDEFHALYDEEYEMRYYKKMVQSRHDEATGK